MRKFLTVAGIVFALLIGYMAGYNDATYSIVDVEKSETGFQVYFEDGTGYWYEY